MNTVEDSNASFILELAEVDDVGANLLLSTTSPPPPTKPKTRTIAKVKSSRMLPRNRVNKAVVAQNSPQKEITQYELPRPGGQLVQVKVEQVLEDHDYAPAAAAPPVKEYFCGMCGKSYSCEKSVRLHMTRTHGGSSAANERKTNKKNEGEPLVKKFECEECGKKYTTAAQLRYHIRVHTGERPYQCPACPKAFTVALYLKTHVRIHTGERPYQCKVCPKAFASQAALQRHDKVHTGEKPYTCEECGKSFSQSNTKKLHYLTVHLKQPWPYKSKERRLRQLLQDGVITQIQVVEAEEDVGANVVLCTTSPPPPLKPRPRTIVKVISSRMLPRNRVKAVVVQNVQDDYCIETDIEEIAPEIETSEITQDGEHDTTEFIAELCQPQSQSPQKEITQYELPRPGGQLVQVKVEQVFEDHDHDYAPAAAAAACPVQEYYCGVCGKSYSCEKSVRQHMTRTHGGSSAASVRKTDKRIKGGPRVKRFECEECGKKYTTAAQLRYHTRVHTGERPYQCPACPKAFTMPLNLKTHIRIHTGERPYQCSVCPKAFASQAALQRHDKVHTGEKPYTCEECGKSFSQSNTKKLHYLTVHLKQPWPYKSKERRLRQLLQDGVITQMDPADTDCDSPPAYSRRVALSLEHGLLDGD